MAFDRRHLRERFEDGYIPEPNSGCWIWIKSTTFGYGQLAHNGKGGRAHRVSYMLHTGHDIPKGMVVRHKCDTPSCVNPDHLVLGTMKDNTHDAIRRGRFSVGQRHSERCADRRGVSNPAAKLTPEHVLAIRAADVSLHGERSRLARRFGVSQATITLILQRKVWADV